MRKNKPQALFMTGTGKGTHKSLQRGELPLARQQKRVTMTMPLRTQRKENPQSAPAGSRSPRRPCRKEHAQTDRAKIRPIEHQHGRFSSQALRFAAKVMMSMAAAGIGLQKHREKHAPARKVRLERAKREGHRALETMHQSFSGAAPAAPFPGDQKE